MVLQAKGMLADRVVEVPRDVSQQDGGVSADGGLFVHLQLRQVLQQRACQSAL